MAEKMKLVPVEPTETQAADLMKAAQSAYDSLIELNEFNYTHEDVCDANNGSVEAMTTLHDALCKWRSSTTLDKAPSAPAGEEWLAGMLSEKLERRTVALDAALADVDRLKLAICGGEDVPGAINAVSVEDCESFIREERARTSEPEARGAAAWAKERVATLEASAAKTEDWHEFMPGDVREEMRSEAKHLRTLIATHPSPDETADKLRVAVEALRGARAERNGSGALRYSLPSSTYDLILATLSPKAAEGGE